MSTIAFFVVWLSKQSRKSAKCNNGRFCLKNDGRNGQRAFPEIFCPASGGWDGFFGMLPRGKSGIIEKGGAGGLIRVCQLARNCRRSYGVF